MQETEERKKWFAIGMEWALTDALASNADNWTAEDVANAYADGAEAGIATLRAEVEGLRAVNAQMMESLQDAACELEALAKARESNYARPDPDCIAQLRAAIDAAKADKEGA